MMMIDGSVVATNVILKLISMTELTNPVMIDQMNYLMIAAFLKVDDLH